MLSLLLKLTVNVLIAVLLFKALRVFSNKVKKPVGQIVLDVVKLLFAIGMLFCIIHWCNEFVIFINLTN